MYVRLLTVFSDGVWLGTRGRMGRGRGMGVNVGYVFMYVYVLAANIKADGPYR